jgi:hypothetical protein
MRHFLAVAAALLAFPLHAADGDAAPRASTGATRPSEPAQAAAPRSRLFERLDRNRDGFLSRDEMDSAEARAANWIASDRDNDGRISRAEFNEITETSSQARR